MAKWEAKEKTWERQPRESPQAYEAFDIYLKLGTERSINKVAQALNKSHALIGRWSTTWSWVQRSRDYDNELKRQEFEEAKKQKRNMDKRHIQTGVLLQKKAVEALNKISAEDLSPKDIIRFITLGADLEKKAMASDTEDKAKASGNDDQSSSLADTIISAYQKRKDGGNV